MTGEIHTINLTKSLNYSRIGQTLTITHGSNAMQLSTAARYALRAMVDLAQHADQGAVQRVDIARRQALSEAYLAQLLLKLRRAGLVDSVRGPGGGYVLAQDPAQIRAADVLRGVEETLAPVYCVNENREQACHRADGCPTQWLWERLGQAVNEVLEGVTLAELCAQAQGIASGQDVTVQKGMT
jgi:Rrf2 family protein